MIDTPESDESVVSEFAIEIRKAGGPTAMAEQFAEMKGWAAAFIVACDAAGTDATVPRAIYKAMRERGFEVLWPLRLGEP